MVKKRLASLLLAFLLLSLNSAPASSDGMIVSPPNYQAFETGQKAVLWYENGVETMIISTTFKGDTADFGWIIPVPEKPEVEKGEDEIFTSLQQMTGTTYKDYDGVVPLGTFNLSGTSKSPVTVVETKKVDIYDITVLTSTESEALAKWFKENDYPYPVSQAYILDDYIENEWYFVAAKIDTAKLGRVIEGQLREGHATPLMIKFKTDRIVYPLRISSITNDPESKNEDIAYQEGFNTSTGGWYGYGAAVTLDRQKPFEGTGSLRVRQATTRATTTNIDQNEQANTIRAYHGNMVRNLTVGQEYTFSAYVKATDSFQTNAKLLVSLYGIDVESSPLALTDDWQRISLTFKPVAKTHQIAVAFENTAADTSYFIDAVQVEKGSQTSDFKLVPGTGSTAYQPISTYNPNQPIPVLLYIFDKNNKVEIPGFSILFAGWIKENRIEKMAVDSQGEPLLRANQKMYLTKLQKQMTTAQMTSDLFPRPADNNQPVGTGQTQPLDLKLPLILLIFAVPLTIEVIFVYWLFRKRISQIQKKDAKLKER